MAHLPQILLLGASGRTGRLVVDEALERGHNITILVRRPDPKLPAHQNLTIAVGDPCKTEDVMKALSQSKPKSPVIIVSTLGQARASGSPFAAATSPPRFMEAATKATISAIQASPSVQVDKFIVMSGQGVGDSYSSLNFLMKLIFKYSPMAQSLEDQDLVDCAVRESGIPFVLPRATMLKGEGVAPLKFFGASGNGAGFMPSVSPASVAHFMLDAAVSKEWDGMSPVLSN